MLIQSCWNVLQAGNRMLHVAVPFRVQPQPSRPTFYLNAKGEFWINEGLKPQKLIKLMVNSMVLAIIKYFT